MVGPPFDFLENPLGAVRLSFDRAVASSAAADPVAPLYGKDWGAIDLFRTFLFDEGAISRVPILDASSIRWIQPNTLVRFRGMVQDMFGNELYVGAFKDGSTWRTNKFTDVGPYPIPPMCETRLWERRLLYCVPVPGQNAWTLESSPPPNSRESLHCSSQHGEKRHRDGDLQSMVAADDEHSESSFRVKKLKEDQHFCGPSDPSPEVMIQDASLVLSDRVHSFDAHTISCLVKVYDMPEGEIKLNDVLEFIGVYTFDPELVVHEDATDDLECDFMEDVLAHLPPSKVPRLHCLISRKLAIQDFLSSIRDVEPLPSVVRGIRESLLVHLTAILGNDGLAAQCVLLHLLSRLRARVDVVAVGKLSLNLTSFTRENSSIFGNRLTSVIQSLLPFSQVIPLSVEYLNTATVQPRKDNQTGRLVTGILQLAQGTHLIIDETHLQAGTLDSKGVENASLLKHLMEWQTVEYDFQYYKLEMATDIQMLVLSEGKSNILPADLVVPFCPTSVPSVASPSDELLQSWRWYLATLRSLPHSSEPEIHHTLQDEMVEAMREDRSVGCTDLNRWLTMAQLVSASFGERKLSLSHWQMVKELERHRKQRLK